MSVHMYGQPVNPEKSKKINDSTSVILSPVQSWKGFYDYKIVEQNFAKSTNVELSEEKYNNLGFEKSIPYFWIRIQDISSAFAQACLTWKG